MKTLRTTLVVLFAVAALMGLGAIIASAATGGATPMTAIPVDNQPDPIGPNTSVWYRFDYAVDSVAGTKPTVTLTEVNGTNSGVGFEIWAPGQINDMAHNSPIGQGTAANVDCNTGEPAGPSSGCQSPDLTWVGQLGANGTYYVQVNNTNPGSVMFNLMIKGSGVTLAPQAALAPKADNAVPVALAGNSPTNSLVFDNKRDTIGANTTLWYHFNYAFNIDGTKPVTTLTMPFGTNSGVGFEIWAPGQINDMAHNSPIGQGTAAYVDCNTGEVAGPSSGCQSTDLTWVGQLGAPGVYYVQVNNTNAAAATFNLVITGSGVSLTP